MNEKKLALAFICISFLFWLIVNYFFPILITIELLESKLFYFLLKNLTFALFVTFFAVIFFPKMLLPKVAIWLFIPIVMFPVFFSVVTFYFFIDAGVKTLRELIFGSIAELCMYWLVSLGIFYALQQLKSRKSLPK